jgi:endogenous inhibitor of DNA gyrase (YacG/DUF329 family)
MAQSMPPSNPAKGKCPICRAPTEHAYRPFCSRRCADVDLSRWLRGAYAVPDATESEDGDEAAPAQAKPGDETN